MQIMILKATTGGTFWVDVVLKLRNFSTNNTPNCSMRSRLSTYQVFFSSVTLKTHASSCRKTYLNRWNDELYKSQCKHKKGKFDSSYLINQHDDLASVLYFSKQTLLESI